MKNLVFKAQVAALFEKTAFGQDPRAVAAIAPPRVANRIHRGLGLMEGAKGVAGAGRDAAAAGYSLLGKVLDPTVAPNGLLERGVKGIGNAVASSPRLAGAAIGTAALTPILAKAFSASQKREEDELVNAHPTRVIQASLNDFLEKKAELYSMTKTAAGGPHPFSPGNAMIEGLGKGVGSAFGGTVVGAIAQLLGSGGAALMNRFSDEPKRKALVESLLRTDPVLSDAVKRHPDSLGHIMESYKTMTRFAPALSMDPNAVRSFLRESVLGGAGVNYATIKNLVDTERSIADAKPQYGGR